MEKSFGLYQENPALMRAMPPQFIDPFADLCFGDGRRYRVLIEETCVREGDPVLERFGSSARFAIDYEVLLHSNSRWGESGHPRGFSVIVSLEAVRGGALESVGYGAPHYVDRVAALLLLARLTVHRYLDGAGGGSSYSTHTRPRILWVPSPFEENTF